MKTLVILLTLSFLILLILKVYELFRISKHHKKLMEDLNGIISELKKKQITLNQQVKAIQLSEEHQKAQLNNIYFRIYHLIDRYFSNKKNHDKE